MFLKNFARGFVEQKPLLVVILFGLIGVFAPAGSIFVASLKGNVIFAQFNSTMLMVLPLLVIVFFVIKTFDFLFNRNTKLFIATIIFLLLVLISFILNLITFISL